MPPTSVQTEILNALTDVEDKDFESFCYALRGGAERPRIRASEVGQKTRVQVTKLLISRCTESGALVRVIKTLRDIGCNNEALKLASRNKAYLVSTLPTSRESTPSPPKPLSVMVNNEQKKPQNRKKAETKAKTSMKPGRTTLQFGKYEGSSFKWLLQNDVGYVGYVVGSHLKEREEGDTGQDAFMKHKDALADYAFRFPAAVKEIRFYQQGLAPLGFGKKYPDVPLQDLYNSRNYNMKSYVDYLRGMEETCTRGSPMEAAIKYVLHRDKSYGAPRRSSSRSMADKQSEPAVKKQRLY